MGNFQASSLRNVGMDDDAEQLHREILSLKSALERELGMPTRRDVLKVGSAAVLGGGAMAVFGGSAAASDGSASGEIGTSAEPALRVYVDTFHFHERTSDPSSPSNGDMWYNSSA